MNWFERYFTQSSAPPPRPTGELDEAGWERVLAAGRPVLIECEAVGGRFHVAPEPVAGAVTFTPEEIRRLRSFEEARAAYMIKSVFNRAEVTR